MSDFKLTYATMFNTPDAVHQRFEAALAETFETQLGKTHAMLINNEDIYARADLRQYFADQPVVAPWAFASGHSRTCQWSGGRCTDGVSHVEQHRLARTGAAGTLRR